VHVSGIVPADCSAESINNANLSVGERTAVNPVNATILLLQLKTKHHNKYKAKALNWNEVDTTW
jgi:hypothetical protein